MNTHYLNKCLNCDDEYRVRYKSQICCSERCFKERKEKIDPRILNFDIQILSKNFDCFKKERKYEKTIKIRRRKKHGFKPQITEIKKYPKQNKSHPFYDSKKWLQIRYLVMRNHVLRFGRKCSLCGSSTQKLHVDHIKPRSKYPDLALDINNLQVLCQDCNFGKSNTDETDWRVK